MAELAENERASTWPPPTPTLTLPPTFRCCEQSATRWSSTPTPTWTPGPPGRAGGRSCASIDSLAPHGRGTVLAAALGGGVPPASWITGLDEPACCSGEAGAPARRADAGSPALTVPATRPRRTWAPAPRVRRGSPGWPGPSWSSCTSGPCRARRCGPELSVPVSRAPADELRDRRIGTVGRSLAGNRRRVARQARVAITRMGLIHPWRRAARRRCPARVIDVLSRRSDTESIPTGSAATPCSIRRRARSPSCASSRGLTASRLGGRSGRFRH